MKDSAGGMKYLCDFQRFILLFFFFLESKNTLFENVGKKENLKRIVGYNGEKGIL